MTTCKTCGASYDPEKALIAKASPEERTLRLRLHQLRRKQAKLEKMLEANILEQARLNQALGQPHE